MLLSALFGWIALALVPLTAIVAFVLRRLRKGTFIVRMRPHFLLGYTAVIFTVLHLSLSMSAMGGENGDGIWLATFALFALSLQAFIGTNLQSPGSYRRPLRRWHILLFIAAFAFALGHVFLNAG